MERRVLLAITLSFLVLFLFQRFVMPPPAAVPAAPPAGTTAGQCPGARLQHLVPPDEPCTRRHPTAPAGTRRTGGARDRCDGERSERARNRRRDDEGQSGLLESRRDDRALDPEGVPHRRRAAARSRARRRRRGCDQAVHADRRRSGDQRALEGRDLSRHRQRRARRRDGRCDRVAADDRLRDGVRRRVERQEDVRASSRRATSCRSAPSCRWAASG